MRDTALVPTNEPFKQEGPAMAPLPLFLEELEAGTGTGQEHPEALCGESRLSRTPWPQPGSLEPMPRLRCQGQSCHLNPYLPIGGRNEAQKLVHVAHGQPVHEQLHRGLHPLRMKEVPHHLGDSAAT